MFTTKKAFVCILIFLLTLTATAGTFSPAKADTWTDINTLPYTITSPGNYRLTTAFNGSGVAIAVNASNVVLDGQNYLINMSRTVGDNGVRINNGSQNVLVQNLKIRNAVVAVQGLSNNFTVQNSVLTLNLAGVVANDSQNFNIINTNMTFNLLTNLLTRNCSYFTIQNCNILNGTIAGATSTYSDHFQYLNCKVNNNVAGFLLNDSQNFQIMNCQINNNKEIGFLAGHLSNFTYQGNEMSNGTLGAILANSDSYQLRDSSFTNNTMAYVSINGTKVQLSNVSLTNNTIANLILNGTQTTIEGSSYFGNDENMLAETCTNMTVAFTTVKNSTLGLEIFNSNNITLNGVTIQNMTMSSEFILAQNLTLNGCTFKDNYFGAIALASSVSVANSQFINNSLIGLYLPLTGNLSVTNNLFSGNGYSTEEEDSSYGGGLFVADCNCTVYGNTFLNNNEAIIWGASSEDDICNAVFSNNNFQTNNNTLFIYYRLPNNFTNHQFNFYNNLVNDSRILDQTCLSQDYSGTFLPFSSNVFHFNTTMQAGTRIYSDGRMISGNFWAFPNGTGPSQTAVDANHDGFADAPFNVFGDGVVYDIMPYSTGYVSGLTLTAGASQSLIANQTSGVVTVKYSDALGDITSGLTVNLASNSTTAVFYSDQTALHPITTLTIASGQSSGSFYFKDTSAGHPTITASAAKATSAQTQFTISSHADTADHITVTPAGSTIKANQTVVFTTTAYDVYGNSWTVTADYQVNGEAFTGNSLTGRIPGVYSVTATALGKTGSTTLTVTPGDLDHFSVYVPTSVPAGTAFPIQVDARDSLGNTVTAFNGAVTLSVNGTSISPATSGSFVNGEWIGTVTVSTAGTYQVTAADANGHSGKSLAFTVTSTSAATPTPTPTSTSTPTATPPQSGDSVQASKTDGSTVTVQLSGNITSTQINNMQISTTETENATQTVISFTVSGPSGEHGFSNMTIPKNQVAAGSTPTVFIDGEIAANQGYTQDSENFYVWYVTSFSQHTVEIEFLGGAAPPAETPVWLYAAAIVVIIVVAAAVLLLLRRKHK